MQKLIAKILINTLPMPVLAEIVQDKRRQDDRVAKALRRWGKQPTILEEDEVRLFI